MKKSLPVTLFGDRVIVQQIDETIEGSIVLPHKQNRQYELGEVVALGDGRKKNGIGGFDHAEMLVEVGDYVWFQINAVMAQNSILKVGGKLYMHIMQHDLIAKLTNPTVKLENFRILGHWVLLQSWEDRKDTDVIIRPDTAQVDHAMLRYKVLQKGQLVDQVEIGQEVLVDKMHMQLVAINDQPLFYLDDRHICGIVSDSAK